MAELLKREAVYLWYYTDILLRQIAPYWVLGILLGSFVSVFFKQKINDAFARMQKHRWGLWGLVPAALLGIASPLCMYGTIPIAASFAARGMREDWLASFMMCSVLLNPQLIFYSAALGTAALAIRLVSCFLCGIAAGLLVHFLCRKKSFFCFEKMEEPANHDTDANILLRLLKNIGRNCRATGLYFLAGIILSAVFQRYVPADAFAALFGESRRGIGVLLAATIGVPLYACGGGTIPLLSSWLASGMSLGSAAAFMLTGPSTKITNLGALKIVLGFRNFLLYLVFVLLFAAGTGLLIDLFL